ncbi:phage head closure protein [Undibacterium curvum]|uniref:phage head closure protein n=1 Tax=Undibacterium curvum TaxID=2762294 RepID=UPI003D096383
MRSEELDSFVEMQQLVPGKSTAGQPMTTWQLAFTCWASVLDLSGNQYIASGASRNSVVSSIKVRYDERLLPTMRVKHDGGIYDIESILRSKDRRWMTLMCKKGVSNG